MLLKYSYTNCVFVNEILLILSTSVFILFDNSIDASNVHAFDLPIPFIFISSSNVIYLKSLILYFFSISFAISDTPILWVPSFIIIDNNSLLLRFVGPTLNSLSLGLSLVGICLIKILSLLI